MRIDVAMPTWDSEDVIDVTLTHLLLAFSGSDWELNRLLVEDRRSTDDTREILRRHARSSEWDVRINQSERALPAAREQLIERVDTEWFLFLDDDVRLTANYLEELAGVIAPSVGAIQGRKASRTELPSEWVRRRSRRGGCHATLLRRAAAAEVDFPDDALVLEDEFLRRHVESGGYLWVFNHSARFGHDCQNRHPIGWQEGRIAGKYRLKPFHEVALNVPFAAATGRNPWPHTKRAAGWLAGWLAQSDGSTKTEREVTS